MLSIIKDFLRGKEQPDVQVEQGQREEVKAQVQEGKEIPILEGAIMGESEIQEGSVETSENSESGIEAQPSTSEEQASSEQAILVPKTREGHPYDEYQGCRENTNLKIVDRSRFPGEFYPFLVDCSCGFQSRVYNKNEAFAVGSRHVGRKINEA